MSFDVIDGGDKGDDGRIPPTVVGFDGRHKTVDIKTVSPGFTPPQFMTFMAPRIICIGLEGPGT